MSNLIVHEILHLLKQISCSDTNEEDVANSGVVEYLDSMVSEAAKADEFSLVVDIEGLKEVMDSFVPSVSKVSGEMFNNWFSSLVAKKLNEKSEPVKPAKAKSENSFNAKNHHNRQRFFSSSSQEENSLPSSSSTDHDEDMKKQMIEKFSYIADNEYQKKHRPHVPVDDNKRLMIRYKDNKVVSTKGDRYAVEKKPESDAIKATYVHIKQYRKFKFH